MPTLPGVHFQAKAGMALDLPCQVISPVVEGECRLDQTQQVQRLARGTTESPGATSGAACLLIQRRCQNTPFFAERNAGGRSEEHTSELRSIMRISYAVFCLEEINR